MTEKSLPTDSSNWDLGASSQSSGGRNATGLGRRGLLLGLLASSFARPAKADEPLVVIVNNDNRDTPSRSDLAAMFTTRKQSWDNGQRIVPFNFPPKHSVRVQFDRSVLQMDPDDVARYWIDRRIRGGNPPPKQVASGRLIVRLVAKLPGAVAYVPRNMIDASVRVVQEL